jgi:hypothetical protein
MQIGISDDNRFPFNNSHKVGKQGRWDSRRNCGLPGIEQGRIRVEKTKLLQEQIRADCEACAPRLQAEQKPALRLASFHRDDRFGCGWKAMNQPSARR